MTEIDLATAVFPEDVAAGRTYGQYADGRIVTNSVGGGYPDFYFPDVVVGDRTQTLTIQLVYDPDDPHDTWTSAAGDRQVWVYVGRDGDVESSYNAPGYELWFQQLFNFSARTGDDYTFDSGTNTVTITIAPEVWTTNITQDDFNTLFFETASNSAVAQMFWSDSGGTPAPVEYPSTRLDSRTVFAT